MKCSKCGKEFEGKFCPECGTPSVAQAEQPTPAPQAYQQPTNAYQNPSAPQKKKGGCLKGGLIVLGVFIVIIIVVAAMNGKGSTPTSASSVAPSAAVSSSIATSSSFASSKAASSSASSKAVSSAAESAVSSTSAAANSPATITKAEFDQIKTGMTYAQVVKIVGGDGSVLSESEVAGIKTVMYMWYGEDGISNANIMIQNNKLVSKAQMGLE